MSENNQANSACDLRGIREAVCVQTNKITDSCLAKDCIEDMHVYLTVSSQQVLDAATGAKVRFVELVHVEVSVEAVPYSAGYDTVDVTFYYRVLADATTPSGQTNTITGLAVFSKRLVLYGAKNNARIFSSTDSGNISCEKAANGVVPEAFVETVDPILLGSKVVEACKCCPSEIAPRIPEGILGCFDEPLVLNGECKRLLATVGQFSITRLERPTQLLIPTFDYCVPNKTCPGVSVAGTENPCEVFSQIEFPMDAFFPGKNETCVDPAESCTGCCKKSDT